MAAEQLPARRRRAAPHDGIIDWIAVNVAVAGTRPVDLTETEQEIAAALLLAAGHSYRTIEHRLRVTNFRAWSLYTRVRDG
jgi:hypothetical protein